METCTPSLTGSSGQDSPSLTGWGIAATSGQQEGVMKSYSELLKDPRWQKVRLKKLEAAEWRCERCMDSETMLSVHHKRYVKGRQPWEYPAHELCVLCQPCHEEEHAMKDMRADFVGTLHADGPASADDIFAVAAGYAAEQTNDENIEAIAARFLQETPYQFMTGRTLALLMNRFNFTIDGICQLCDALSQSPPEPDLIQELEVVFSSHGLLRKPRT